MDSVADDSPKAEASQGRFLLSLESELPQDDFTIDAAIRIHALFSRRVCLPDSHLIDSPSLETFFEVHDAELQHEVERAQEQDRPPMLGTLSRAGADISGVLDLMLTPNERTGLPTYLSRLRPEQNAHFREAVPCARTAEERRAFFFKIAGKRFADHLVRATKYFQGHPISIVPRSGDPKDELFQAVREQIILLQEPSNISRLTDADRAIRDALLKEMDANQKGQTRERLHLAIYGGALPHYYQGQVQSSAEGDEFRHPWRHLVNTLYSCNLANKYSCSPVCDSKWFELPSCLSLDEYAPNLAKAEKVDNIKVVPLYLKHWTIDFISNVRTQGAFWKSLEELEKAAAHRDSSKYLSAFKEHLRFVMERFSEHLINTGYPNLVRTKTVDLWKGRLRRGLAASTAILAGVAAWRGLPTESFVNFMTDVGKITLITGFPYFVVTELLDWSGSEVTNPDVKSFEIYLSRIAS